MLKFNAAFTEFVIECTRPKKSRSVQQVPQDHDISAKYCYRPPRASGTHLTPGLNSSSGTKKPSRDWAPTDRFTRKCSVPKDL